MKSCFSLWIQIVQGGCASLRFCRPLFSVFKFFSVLLRLWQTVCETVSWHHVISKLNSINESVSVPKHFTTGGLDNFLEAFWKLKDFFSFLSLFQSKFVRQYHGCRHPTVANCTNSRLTADSSESNKTTILEYSNIGTHQLSAWQPFSLWEQIMDIWVKTSSYGAGHCLQCD